MGRHLWRAARLSALAAALTAAAAPLVASSAPAVTGPLSLHGAVLLDEFPCLPGAGCTGTFLGQASGVVTGTDVSGAHFVATFPDPTSAVAAANLQASYGYSESCAAGLIPPTGTATGTFELHGGMLVEGGVVSHGATVSGGFGWLRAGTAVVISTSATTLQTSSGTVVASGAFAGEGSGLFLPTNGPGTCQAPVFGQQATVAGVVLQPS